MSCGRTTNDTQKRLTATSTTATYEWFTGWMPAIGIDTIRATVKNRAVSGNLQVDLLNGDVDWLVHGSRVTIYAVPDFGSDFAAWFGSDVLWVFRTSGWERILAMWQSDDHEPGSCATGSLASALLHELTHLAGFTLWDLPVDAECYQAFVIENTFRWALFNR